MCDATPTKRRAIWLPQYAATWNARDSLMLYGNYSVMLSLGPQAPFWAGGFYLPPLLHAPGRGGCEV